MAYQFLIKKVMLPGIMLFASAQAHAAVPSMLMPNFKTVEAGSIELVVDPSSGTGFAIARECSGCPIKASVDKNTKFVVKGKSVSLHRALTHSLKYGTIQYKVDSMHAILILW